MSAIEIPNDGALVFYAEGSAVAATVFADATTYYAEIPLVGDASKTALQVDYDATLVGAVTLQFCNKSDSVNFYDAPARNWAAAPASVPAITIAGGSASTQLVAYSDNSAKRARVKLAVTTGTILAGFKAFAHHKR